MGGGHIVWKLWLFICAVWLAMLAAAIGWLLPGPDWTDALHAAFAYGIAPVIGGSVLIYWSCLIAPWRADRRE
jgi:hypothetical protein